MTFTWVRDTNAKEKPMAPNNPIFDFECGITISLVYKGAKYKRCSGFFWALAQSEWEPISISQMGPGCPTNSPRQSGGRDGGRDGGMRVWWIYLESQEKGRSLYLPFFLSHRLSRISLRNHNETLKTLKRLSTFLWFSLMFWDPGRGASSLVVQKTLF